MRTDVDSCHCTRGLCGHRKSLHRKLTPEEKSHAMPGTQTRISIAPSSTMSYSCLSITANHLQCYYLKGNVAGHIHVGLDPGATLRLGAGEDGASQGGPGAGVDVEVGHMVPVHQVPEG